MNSFNVAVKSMVRNRSMSIASVILVFLTVLIVGFGSLIVLNATNASKEALNNLQIRVFVKNGASDEEINAVKSKIEQLGNIEEITVSSEEEELENISQKIEGGEKVKELFADSNPLNTTISVRLIDGSKITETAQTISGFENVDDVSSGSDKSATDNFVNFMNTIALYSLIFAIILLVISIFIIVNTIKLTITSRSLEIEIMRLVGATKSYVRKPFVVEGIIIGVIGALLAYVILIFVYHQAYGAIKLGSVGISPDLLIGFNEIILPLFIFVMAIGIIIGAIGSFISTSKYLHK